MHVDIVNFETIYIVDSKCLFDGIENQVVIENDLILTFDLALVKYIEKLGGSALYLDHLRDAKYMHQENHNIYKFFENCIKIKMGWICLIIWGVILAFHFV